MKLFLRFSFALLLILSAAYSAAGEDALYKTPPPGSAFVRVFNIQSGKPVAAVSLATANISQVEPLTSSDFVFVDAKATTSIQIDQQTLPVSLQDGKFHTLVYDGASLKNIILEPLTDKRKALVHLINLTSAPADLKTVKGDVAIIPDVKPASGGARAINPVKIAFGVFAGGNKIAESPEIFIDRGVSGSLFVFNQAGSIKTLWTEDTLSTEK
ncbi:MAG TPA: alginate O-acetyltransferase AlgF [Cellvibrio sp.]|nr:alginate O-acetyltransferase AlgF [Cellvibrio sp.]